MNWTEKELAALPEKGGFRLRGVAMTRLEVFSDAAFAFAITMLVISLEEIPGNYEELMIALRGVPSFACSFVIMGLVWVANRRWSERFGLDDGISTALTFALIFVVLVYLYPLKMIMDLTFYGLLPGMPPTDLAVDSVREAAGLIAVFAIGFLLLATVMLGLYTRAARCRDALCLNERERLLVQKEQIVWLVQVIAGLAASLFALLLLDSIGYLAGVFFSLLPIAVPLATLPVRRRIQSLSTD